MKQMTATQRKKIQSFIKNGLDISKLIEGYSIKNENLSGAKIMIFNRSKDDMCGVNLSRSVVGAPGVINNISGSKLRNCNFSDADIQGILYARRCDCRDGDFSGAIFSNVEYQFTDFRGAKFCEACLRLGTVYGMGAIFDTNFFADLTKGWNLNVTKKDEE